MKKRIPVIVTLAATLAACAGTLQTASITEAYKKYEKAEYAATLELVTRAEAAGDMPPERRAEMAYLKALAHEGLGDRDTAATLYRFLEDQHPGTQYAYLATEKLAAIP